MTMHVLLRHVGARGLRPTPPSRHTRHASNAPSTARAPAKSRFERNSSTDGSFGPASFSAEVRTDGRCFTRDVIMAAAEMVAVKLTRTIVAEPK